MKFRIMKRRSEEGPLSSQAPTAVSSLFWRFTSPTLRILSVKLAGNASDVTAFIGCSSCSDAHKAIHQSRQVTLIREHHPAAGHAHDGQQVKGHRCVVRVRARAARAVQSNMPACRWRRESA
jgi:hypothetical protein